MSSTPSFCWLRPCGSGWADRVHATVGSGAPEARHSSVIFPRKVGMLTLEGAFVNKGGTARSTETIFTCCQHSASKQCMHTFMMSLNTHLDVFYSFGIRVHPSGFWFKQQLEQVKLWAEIVDIAPALRQRLYPIAKIKWRREIQSFDWGVIDSRQLQL